MPFTFDGNWVPRDLSSPTQQPVKVRLVKRGHNFVTVILHLPMSEKELKSFSSKLKKRLGCGGALKGIEIEIQGDKVDLVQQFLLEHGIKSS